MEGGPHTSGQSVRIWRRMRSVLRAPRAGGFTIIEVMIVLVVSGALFLSAAALISGRQNQTAFDQAIRQVQAQVQQTINEVAVGYFPDNESFQCENLGGVVALSPGAGGQGTNSDCIFFGKAMQFQVGTSKPEQFTTFTITALQQTCNSPDESACIAQANPAVVAPSLTHSSATYPDARVTQSLQSGLTTARMWYNNGGPDVPIGAVSFTNSLTRSSVNSITSGTGQVNVIPVDGTSLGTPNEMVAQAINADGGSDALATSPINPSGGVFICFSSGGTNQYGIIRIGGENRSLAVNLTIKNKGGASCTYP